MLYQPQFTVSARLIGELEAIAVLRERILEVTVQVPWMPNLQRDARVRNTHSSTAIEGNPLTRIIHDGSSRNRGVAQRDGRAEPGGREASLNRMLTDRAASPPAWAL